MAKKSANTNRVVPKKVTKPDLFAADKIKEHRYRREVSSIDISLNSDLGHGSIERLEFKGGTDKYSLSKINMIGKVLNYKVLDHNTQVEKTGKGFKIETELLTMHDFLPPEPILAKNKVPKELAETNKPVGPNEAVLYLIKNGFFKIEKISANIVLDKCQKEFKRNYLIKSIRNSLDIYIESNLLRKDKIGKYVYYKEKD